MMLLDPERFLNHNFIPTSKKKMLTFLQGTLTDNYLSLNLSVMLQKTAALVVLVIDGVSLHWRDEKQVLLDGDVGDIYHATLI